MSALIIPILLVVVSLVYATVGQAGGTAFLAIMAALGIPAAELRPTALILNIIASGYATWRLYAAGTIDWRLLISAGAASLPASFVGGLIVLDSAIYYTLTGCILLFAAAMMVTKWKAHVGHSPGILPASLVGGVAGFASGITGVGGGVFLAPVLIGFGWATARQAANLSAPFILSNSITGLVGVLATGQRPAADVGPYAVAALAGAVTGTMIGQRFMSERTTRYVLAAILVVAGANFWSTKGRSMIRMLSTTVAAALLLASTAHAQTQPYAALKDRPIKALSAEDIANLRAGRGMGMALPAELNRYPDPMHVLENAVALQLTANQKQALDRQIDAMRAAAILLGEQIIARESALDALFKSGNAAADAIDAITSEIAILYGQLRAVHLRTHLATRATLTETQLATYQTLSGYDAPGAVNAGVKMHRRAGVKVHHG